MHIENVTIHLGTPALGAAMLAALMRLDPPEQREQASQSASTAPAVGQPWPGVDGIYAGISRGENGEPDAHLVLLNARPADNMKWEDAVAWAQGLGDGGRLPTRFESALLYANLQDQFETDCWHWTGTQCSSLSAWSQGFTYGTQTNNDKEFEARARAVRRLIL